MTAEIGLLGPIDGLTIAATATDAGPIAVGPKVIVATLIGASAIGGSRLVVPVNDELRSGEARVRWSILEPRHFRSRTAGEGPRHG